MNIEDAEKLLVAFYEGTTTREEERELAHFFETEETPEHLENDKDLFLAMKGRSDIEMPEGLEKRLEGLIDTWNEQEKHEVRYTYSAKSKRTLIWISGIAASFLLLFSIWNHVGDEQAPIDTYSNPKDAYIETRNALMLVSNNLNKGMKQLESASQEMEKIDNILNKQLK